MHPEAIVRSEDQEVEVLAKAKRRNLTAEYKLGVLSEAARCKAPGELGALLRREGLYSSQLYRWRRARERGELAGLVARKRGPKARAVDERDKQIAQLERDNRKLRARAERAEALVELQKKVSELLGVQLPQPGTANERT